jgi:hypothetical protein
MPGAISTSELLDVIDRAIRVELDGLRPGGIGDDVLLSDPVMEAFSTLMGRLRAATGQIMLDGTAALDGAINAISECWVSYRAQLGARATELSDAFRHALGEMVHAMMDKLARLVPAQVAQVPPMSLATISFKLSFALSPSVVASATEWFRLLAVGGIEVSATYNASASAT